MKLPPAKRYLILILLVFLIAAGAYFWRSTEDNSMEWWYLDGTLDDGTQLSIAYKTKAINKQPTLYVFFLWPDGTTYTKALPFEPAEFSASRQQWDVKMGRNTFNRQGDNYILKLALDDLALDLKLEKLVAPPGPVRYCFKPQTNQDCCDWEFPVLKGRLTGTLNRNGNSEAVSGLGYSDHVWGDMSEKEFSQYQKQWYWGRAWFGDYTVFFNKNVHRGQPEKTTQMFLIYRNQDLIVNDFSRAQITEKLGGDGPPIELDINYSDDKIKAVLELRKKEFFPSISLDLDNGSYTPYRKGAVNYSRATGPGTLKLNFEGKEEVLSAAPVWELMEYGDTR